MNNNTKNICIIALAVIFVLIYRVYIVGNNTPTVYVYIEEPLTLHDNTLCRIIRYKEKLSNKIIESWAICDWSIEISDDQLIMELHKE